MSQHTRYADKFLLNGAQAITFNTNLQRNDSLDVNILDSQLTRVDRLFKRDNVSVAITHDGVQIPALNENVNQTTRAYLEADDNYATANIDGAYLTEDQSSVWQAMPASSFRFGSGAHLGEVVQAINSRTGSTGVKAQLIFSSRVTSQVGAITGEDYSVGGDGGVPQVYGAEVNKSDTGGSGKVVSVAAAADVQTRLRAGMNTDGQGRVFARVLDLATGGVEYFKDKECTVMIGTGNNGTFTPANNCGLNADDIILTLDAATAQAGDVYTIALGGMVLDESLGGGDFINSEDLSFSGFGPNGFNFFSGIDLGHNTDAYGRLYFEATGPANDRTISI